MQKTSIRVLSIPVLILALLVVLSVRVLLETTAPFIEGSLDTITTNYLTTQSFRKAYLVKSDPVDDRSLVERFAQNVDSSRQDGAVASNTTEVSKISIPISANRYKYPPVRTYFHNNAERFRLEFANGQSMIYNAFSGKSPLIKAPVKDQAAIPYISSVYGPRKTRLDKAVRMHYGTDFKMAEGTPVVSAYDGRVTFTELDPTKYSGGIIVYVLHDNGIRTEYMHLSKIKVKVGQYVKQGQVIALSGNTGGSTGAHLHFNIVKLQGGNKIFIDPLTVINWKDYGFGEAVVKDKPNRLQSGKKALDY